MTRLFLIIAAIGAIVIGTGQLTAQASPAGWTSYDEAEFVMAQKKGRIIVVDIHAQSCPTCRAQAAILEELRQESQSADVLFITADFDEDKAFLRTHRIPRQPSVLVFSGMDEVARLVAETDRTRLRGAVLGAS